MNENIYSSVPDWVLNIYGDKEVLKKFFKLNKGKWITSKIIAKHTGFNVTATCTELREMITRLIVEESWPIVSGNKGYKLTGNPDKLEKYRQKLIGRLKGLKRRIRGVKRAKERLHGGFF